MLLSLSLSSLSSSLFFIVGYLDICLRPNCFIAWLLTACTAFTIVWYARSKIRERIGTDEHTVLTKLAWDSALIVSITIILKTNPEILEIFLFFNSLLSFSFLLMMSFNSFSSLISFSLPLLSLFFFILFSIKSSSEKFSMSVSFRIYKRKKTGYEKMCK